MSTSTTAFAFAAHHRGHSPRKAISPRLIGGAAVGCLVLGCAWTVHVNIFAASVYPSLDSARFDSPVIRRSSSVAIERRPAFAGRVLAALSEPAPQISAPASVAPSSTLTFDDRFAASAAQGVGPKPPPSDVPPPPDRKVASIAPVPTPPAVAAKPARSAGAAVRDMAQRAKAAVMSIASADKPTISEKLWGKPQSQSQSHGSLLSFASADASFTGGLGTGSLGQNQNPALGGSAPYDRSTAVYDISAHMVYLPDGTKLEAHSGLRDKLDDPSSANIRMRGVTPPHIYELTPREALFHGVPALRLNPVGGEETIYGRSGLLAHTYMLGPNGDSNGCVSFKDYNAFLNAYRNQGIKRLAVVARID